MGQEEQRPGIQYGQERSRSVCEFGWGLGAGGIARRDGTAGAGMATLKMAWNHLGEDSGSRAVHGVLARLGPHGGPRPERSTLSGTA